MSSNRWQARRGLGQFQARTELSSHQQLLLAAVPRWKREWVRPASLKPNQSPTYLVRKWVLDTASEGQEGTEEEMAAAALVIASGDGLEPPTGASTPLPTSGVATPAAEEVVVPNPAKPAHGPADEPDESLPPAQEAVAALEGLELPLPIDVEMEDEAGGEGMFVLAEGIPTEEEEEEV